MKRLTERLANDGTVVTAWSSVPDPIYLSMLAACDFDAVTLDMQHGMQTEPSVVSGIMAIAPSGKPVIVRIPVGRFDFASKALDAGAHAIIAPMINTVDDARAFAAACKYVPLGERSFGPTHAVNVLGIERPDYITQANENTLALAMIETREAVENMEAILDVDGIDGVFCGPADLSISVRQNPLPDPYGPDTIEIVERMASEAKKRGKLAAAFCITTDHLDMTHDFGFRLMAYGFDATYLTTGANTGLAKASFRQAL
ncbi:MAG: aldolase/citrate lyase family protein [Pseudomonadota bacterium]